MKKLLVLPLVAALTLFSSCASVQSTRDKLAEMPETEFIALSNKVSLTARLGGNKLAQVLGEEKTAAAARLTNLLAQAVETDSLDVVDLVQHIVNEYGDKLELEQTQLDHIRDAAKIVDAAVGQIRLGIDGKLTAREKALLLTLLGGLHNGLTQ